MNSFPDWALPFISNVSNLTWETMKPDETSYAFMHVVYHISVIVSGGVEADGKKWLHVSCAYKNRLPSWEDLKMVKETFIGKDKKAIQVLPPDSEYVNVNPYCLHLWHCVNGDGLPDFTTGRLKGLL